MDGNGDVTAEIIDSGIDNLFADNTISDSQNDRGVDIYNELNAEASTEYFAVVNGSVTASIDPSWILNRFDRNR